MAGAEVLGVSRDTVKDQAAFARKFSIPYPLLADPDGTISRAYGVTGGVLRAGMSKRQTFLIGAEGVILRRFEKVDPSAHAAEVLGALAGSGPS